MSRQSFGRCRRWTHSCGPRDSTLVESAAALKLWTWWKSTALTAAASGPTRSLTRLTPDERTALLPTRSDFSDIVSFPPMCLIVILRATLSNCAKHSITNTYPLKYEIVQYFLKSELVVPTYRIIFIFHIHYTISVEKPRNIEYTLLFKLIFFSEYTDTGHLYVYLYKDLCIISGLYFQILELKNLRIHKKQFYTK